MITNIRPGNNRKRNISRHTRFALWACLIAALFQLVSPAVKAAIFNDMLSWKDEGLPSEICTASGDVLPIAIDGTPRQLPQHHCMVCDLCTLCQMQPLYAKAVLAQKSTAGGIRLLAHQFPPHSDDYQIYQKGFTPNVIRGPPFFV